jgi:hypothetical protein
LFTDDHGWMVATLPPFFDMPTRPDRSPTPDTSDVPQKRRDLARAPSAEEVDRAIEHLKFRRRVLNRFDALAEEPHLSKRDRTKLDGLYVALAFAASHRRGLSRLEEWMSPRANIAAAKGAAIRLVRAWLDASGSGLSWAHVAKKHKGDVLVLHLSAGVKGSAIGPAVIAAVASDGIEIQKGPEWCASQLLQRLGLGSKTDVHRRITSRATRSRAPRDSRTAKVG